jgi:hypothetical protein
MHCCAVVHIPHKKLNVEFSPDFPGSVYEITASRELCKMLRTGIVAEGFICGEICKNFKPFGMSFDAKVPSGRVRITINLKSNVVGNLWSGTIFSYPQIFVMPEMWLWRTYAHRWNKKRENACASEISEPLQSAYESACDKTDVKWLTISEAVKIEEFN